MIAMRELTKQNQVSFWSDPEIRMALDRIVSEAQHVFRFRFHDRPVKQQQLMNAVVLYLAGLDQAERRAILETGLDKLRAVLDDSPAVVDEVRVPEAEPEAQPRRRKRLA